MGNPMAISEPASQQLFHAVATMTLRPLCSPIRSCSNTRGTQSSATHVEPSRPSCRDKLSAIDYVLFWYCAGSLTYYKTVAYGLWLALVTRQLH